MGGNVVDQNSNQELALRWNSDGQVSELALPGGARISYGYDINKRGTIVGQYGPPGVVAKWHRDGSRTDLPSLTEDGWAEGFSINNKESVVGISNSVRVIWDARGNIAELPLPDGTVTGVARSITDDDLIFGRVRLSDSTDYISVLWCPVGRC